MSQSTWSLAPSVVVGLAIGFVLLLAWWQDRRQPFTKWLGLSFLVNSTWIVGYLIYSESAPPLKWVGGALWALQQSVSTVLLAAGAWALRDRPARAGRFVAAGAVLALLLFAATRGGAHSAVIASSAPLTVATLVVAAMLMGGALHERIASVWLLLLAASLWIAPLTGFDNFPLQSQASTACRLFLGLTLIYACLQKQATEARRSSEQFTRLIESSHQGVVVMQDGQVAYANPELLRIFGLASVADIPPDWAVLGLSPADRLMNEGRRLQLMTQAAQSFDWEQAWVRRDGKTLHLRLSAWPIEWQGQRAEQVVVTDESDRHDSAQRLLDEAMHDRLTGLPNRLKLREVFTGLPAQQAGTPARRALLLFNVTNFSAINDALGYHAGDEFLTQVARRLRDAMGESELLARIAGDEFLVLRIAPGDPGEIERLGQAMLGVMEQAFVVRGMRFISSASVGAVWLHDQDESFDVLLGHAALATRRARAAGRNMVRFFDDAMNAELLEDVRLGNELHSAIRSGELELFFQPIADVASGAVVGAEALLRWKHPVQGYVPPGRFIPVAERIGLISEVGEWVLHEACRTLAVWQDDPVLGRLTLAINVSTAQCVKGDFDQVVSQALETHQAPRQRLELEVTESALVNEPEEFVDLLERLRGLGVRLAIDDFGTGYSNLAYLQRFKVDKLKVDQSFVRGVVSNPQDAAIVRAIVQLAASLGLTTTAEGVEDPAVLDVLASLGCRQAQGYWLARPASRSSFERWVRDYVAQGAVVR